MALDKTEVAATVANKVGNVSAVGYGLTWAADKLSSFTVQEWVAIAVGLSAIASYGSAAVVNIIKARQLKREQNAQ